MKEIPLSQGKVALVDDADYEAVNIHKWYALKIGYTFYAVRNILKPDGKRTTQYLHQFLMPGVPRVDHRDGNGLNNWRENLRPATHKQNLRGFCHKMTGTSSKFRGVCWHKKALKWEARIVVNGHKIHLGLFSVETDAARARDVAALKYYGEGAQLNFKVA